jgi:hypothetical protein
MYHFIILFFFLYNKMVKRRSLKKKSIKKKRKSVKILVRKNKHYDSGFTVEQNYTPYGCYVPKAFF